MCCPLPFTVEVDEQTNIIHVPSAYRLTYPRYVYGSPQSHFTRSQAAFTFNIRSLVKSWIIDQLH